ncbi:type IV pili twitching motility protein PilT [candidate division WWE3 bacterium RIFCSPHIGHO2_01_FULL_40_23]|uniref:Type IV pili twitching motility protein PilT n=1 Tax=candidate division WWE3 bacterium RIFCSPLOWO2_01_FULL_41_18 TaxID=1802625 RepID=A0A1F4VFD1_UNCKA|nr:MAG: type IV pili twitching motility protein PilT [candidate division WWE3 bacterium RIFCSPHIGHO2_01_FULL_40_23]OGC55413.1 MAG: type IV pili twitching motility protein PilT [candidate division WWE3 bacterium RIFCSPLOWO2_01_FULL_41_18]
MKFSANELLEKTINQKSSDLHVTVGTPPIIRVNTRLIKLTDYQPFTVEDVEFFLGQLLTEEQKEIYSVNREIDFSFSLGKVSRFRVNAFYQRGYPSVALRIIPFQVPTLSQLNLPDILVNLCGLNQGLVLIVGPTGHGKSTTIAAMIDRINSERDAHIVTIEDPIEYVFVDNKSLIEQREMYLDTHSWEVALKSVLRQDPNVVVVGEMRDFETISSAITIAETGHLVLATLHTNSAAQTIDRIIDVFPEVQQQQVRVQLSSILEAIISQRLIPSINGGLFPATEVLLSSPAVRNLIREGKTHQIDNTISTSFDLGMLSLERSLSALILSNTIALEEGLRFTTKPDELSRLIKRG